MGRLQVESRGRWFLNHQLWELSNAEEIRAKARMLNVRLVDASFRAPDEPEAEGKPEEILIKKVTADHSDSGQPSQSAAEADALAAEEARQKAAEEAQAKALAEAKAAEDKAKADAEAKAKAEADADAELKAKVAEKAAKASAAKAEKEAAAKAAADSAE